MVGEIVTYPGGLNVFQLLWACGSIPEILQMLPGVESMARMMGCSEMLVEGPWAWKRLLKPLDYRQFQRDLAGRRSEMGWSDKKRQTSTTSTQDTTTGTTTPNVPTWISDPAKSMAGNITNLMGQGPSAFTPTTSGLENQVTDAAANYQPTSDYTDARSALANVGSVTTPTRSAVQSLLSNLAAYYNPFKEQITNPVLSDYDEQAGQTRAAQAAQAAAGKAFQGSRYGIQEGETEGALARGRAATEGGLLKDMFTESTTLANEDAQRAQQAAMANQSAKLAAQQGNQSSRLAAAQGYAGIDTAQNANQLAGLGLQNTIGQRATDEQQLQQQYPLQFANQTEGLLSGLDPALYTGSTITGHTTGTGTGTTTAGQGLGGWIGDALVAAAGGAGKAAAGAG